MLGASTIPLASGGLSALSLDGVGCLPRAGRMIPGGWVAGELALANLSPLPRPIESGVRTGPSMLTWEAFKCCPEGSRAGDGGDTGGAQTGAGAPRALREGVMSAGRQEQRSL